MADAIENPYIAVANRKVRNLKKKLQNIQKVEAQVATGKSLNEEQLVLLSTKPAVERAMLDIEALKAQLEEVAKEVGLIELNTAAAAAAAAAAAPEEPVVEAPAPVEVAAVTVLEAATETQPIEQVAMSTQCDEAQPLAAAPPPASDGPVYDAEFVQSVLQAQVRKLLKTLHVCSRYHIITGTK
jgi:hypothetical protein